MRKVWLQLLAELRGLGAKVVFASFSKVILATTLTPTLTLTLTPTLTLTLVRD